MLVLTRKENESLIIDGDIRLTILAVKGGQVRVGVEAPKEVPIQRSELLTNESSNQEFVLQTANE